MGLTNDESNYEKFLNWCEDKWAYEYKMTKILSKLSNDDINFLQEQYENRLKTDMVDMLEEIKNSIDYEFHDDGGYYADKDEVDVYIQQKINVLKEIEADA
jgi:ribosome-associated toxin RatA of RatAB toxin-antitoxin module